MKQTRLIMGMPITIEIIGGKEKHLSEIFHYFSSVDERFSTYKKTSEITKINNGLLAKKNYSNDMKTVLKLCEETKRKTSGWFDILHNGKLDPSGLVKGWSVFEASKRLKKLGYTDFYVDAGGDIEISGKKSGNNWNVGIRNPNNRYEIIKIFSLSNRGIATSGTAIRGQHIYNPFVPEEKITEILSLTVIGPNVYEADRFATAAFAMGKKGLSFIESLVGLEGYMVMQDKTAMVTSGLNKYL